MFAYSKNIEVLKIKVLTEAQKEDIVDELLALLSHFKIHPIEIEQVIYERV